MGAIGGIRTIEQRLEAGNDFTGIVSTGTYERTKGIERFDEASVGGLFDFEIEIPHLVIGVELKLDGNTTDWTVHKRDIDEILYCCGTNETHFITTEADSIVLTDRQKLVLRTTGATGPLLARMSIQQVNR